MNLNKQTTKIDPESIVILIEMKTLSKRKLDELAKEMPILSEYEQSTCIGGSRYYTASGAFLGDLDDNYENIRITDASTYAAYSCSPQYMYNNSTLLDDSSETVIKEVYKTLLASIDPRIDASKIHFENGPSGIYNTAHTSMNPQRDANTGEALADPNWQLYFNKNSSLLFNSSGGSNYYDHMLALRHELAHVADYSTYLTYLESGESEDYQTNEYHAYCAIKNSTYEFSKSSTQMKTLVNGFIDDYEKSLPPLDPLVP